MATQADLLMQQRNNQNWNDYFQNAAQNAQMWLAANERNNYTQNSPINNLGDKLGKAVGLALFGERYPTAEGENAGINTDLSQAQSNAYMNDKTQSIVPQDSALESVE